MKLIHIGLPKTGSTSLQSEWAKRTDINYSSDALLPLIQASRQSIRAGTDPNALIRLWPQVSSVNPVTVYSSEGLSGLPWGNRATAEQYDFGHYLFANICKEKVADACVLMLIRSPEQWLRSIYVQMIQEGATQGFARFVREQRDYLSAMLNLSAIVEHWRTAFSDQQVVVYPFEKLVQSPALANQEISQRLGIASSLQLFTLAHKSNVSLSPDNAQLLRALSVLNQRILGRNSQLQLAFNKLNEDMRLLYRVQLQRQPAELAGLRRLLSPLSFALPAAEKHHFDTLLRECFLGEIARQGDPFGILDVYQARIRQYLAA